MEPLIDIEVEADGWLDSLPDVQAVVQTGILAALKAVDVTEQTDIVVLLCDDIEMKSLNKEYRQKNAPTNVLSFPAPKMKGMAHLGARFLVPGPRYATFRPISRGASRWRPNGGCGSRAIPHWEMRPSICIGAMIRSTPTPARPLVERAPLSRL